MGGGGGRGSMGIRVNSSSMPFSRSKVSHLTKYRRKLSDVNFLYELGSQHLPRVIAFQRIDTSNDIVAALRVLHEDPRNFVKFEGLIDGIVLRLSIGSQKSRKNSISTIYGDSNCLNGRMKFSILEKFKFLTFSCLIVPEYY